MSGSVGTLLYSSLSYVLPPRRMNWWHHRPGARGKIRDDIGLAACSRKPAIHFMHASGGALRDAGPPVGTRLTSWRQRLSRYESSWRCGPSASVIQTSCSSISSRRTGSSTASFPGSTRSAPQLAAAGRTGRNAGSVAIGRIGPVHGPRSPGSGCRNAMRPLQFWSRSRRLRLTGGWRKTGANRACLP